MANSGFASSQPLSCDFLPDQAREDLALGFLGRFQFFELLDGQMTLDRLGALPPPQRKDLRGLPLARNQSHDAVAPELERDLNLFWIGGLFFAGAAPLWWPPVR